MEEKIVNQNVTCLLEEIFERLKDISHKEGLNMDHVEKLLGDKKRLENLITHFQYLLDNEAFCDCTLAEFNSKWKPLVDHGLLQKTINRNPTR